MQLAVASNSTTSVVVTTTTTIISSTSTAVSSSHPTATVSTLNASTTQQQQLNQFSNNEGAASAFDRTLIGAGAVVSLPPENIRDSASPTQLGMMSNAAVAAAADLNQYLRASSVSLQSQNTTGGGTGGSSGSGGSSVGGVVHLTAAHQRQYQQHVPLYNDSNTAQSTTPRAVDNQYSFV